MSEVLALEGVEARDARAELALAITVTAGEIATLTVRSPAEARLCGDIAQGLRAPLRGNARFRGSDWEQMSPRAQLGARAMIGRVYVGPSWISNLDVQENVLLRHRHHTRLRDSELATAADALAQRFGLEGVPRRRPDEVDLATLQRCAIVRALLGEPALVLLDEPQRELDEGARQTLRDLIEEATRRGAAVLMAGSEPDALTRLRSAA